ncbi:hypothetical protein [Flavobacterium branchiicola]|uniref:SprT-like family protein n=1 Tax=Flavobacterium branchiicola TaxID=1114875 RepID=A0ABV9PB03_9FLAO|nr:hypothetical protein [Flavobacterium branchiicola]MBS7252994.1 hypothetical protein [Flavobacterium branchiicola]
MKKTPQFIKSALFVTFILLMTNCATEETGNQNSTPSSSEAKTWFDQHEKDYNATVLNYIKELQWQNTIVTDGDSGEVIEVPFVLKNGLSVSNSSADLFNNQHRLMFIKNKQNEFKVFYVQIFTDQKSEKTLDKSYNYYNLQDDFDGAVYIKELSTNISSKLEFKNGNKINSSSQTAKSDQKMCLYYGYWYEDGHFEPLVEMGCYGSPEGDVRDQPGYGGGGGGGKPSGSTENTTLTLVQKIKKNINSDQLNPCPKEVLEELKNATNCDIANVLTKLGASRAITVIIKTETPEGNKPAQTVRTNPQTRYNYTVRISPDYTSATRLFRASNILHELTHAYFMSLIDDYNSTGNPVVFVDTPTLFQAYCDKKYPPKASESPNLHHKEMADTYVKAMAGALQEFQTGIPVGSGETPNQIYTDLAWGGLRGTPIYDQTFPVGSADYNRIEARYAAESNGGTSGSQTAIGKPCKI